MIESIKSKIDYVHRTEDANEEVDILRNKYISLWWEMSSDFPKLDKKYGHWDQFLIQKETNRFIKKLFNHLRLVVMSKDQRQWEQELRILITDFVQNSMKINSEYLDMPLDKERYSKATKEFIEQSKIFNPSMTTEDMFQAIRNVWIMNSIQIILDLEVKNSPSVFAYSMLYPYTDNYLDDPNILKETKIEFNNRFRKRLRGEIVSPINNHEEDIFKLVSVIEDQYNRADYPLVYQSLLAIHRAQERSITQQRGLVSPYQENILAITFEKGGTSVLADGYLVKGELSKLEAEFMFGYGVLLQLADDLRDSSDDKANGHMTIFSQLAGGWYLDNVTNKLFNLIDYFFDTSPILSSKDLEKFKEIIRANCLYLIFDGISNNRHLFSRNYIKKINSHCPYPISYLVKVNKKMKKEYMKLQKSGVDIYEILGDKE